MVTQQKATGRATSIPAGLAAGAGVSVLMTGIICILGGWMIGSEIISQEHIGYCAITALLISAIMGSIVAWKKARRKRLIISLACGIIYYLILAGFTIVFFDGSFRGLGVTLITILAGSVISVLLTNGSGKSITGKRRKKTYW